MQLFKKRKLQSEPRINKIKKPADSLWSYQIFTICGHMSLLIPHNQSMLFSSTAVCRAHQSPHESVTSGKEETGFHYSSNILMSSWAALWTLCSRSLITSHFQKTASGGASHQLPVWYWKSVRQRLSGGEPVGVWEHTHWKAAGAILSGF